jgi:hypothetical protein
MRNALRPYIILATMEASFHNDTIVYSGWAKSSDEAMQLVYALYDEQGWPKSDIKRVDAYAVRARQTSGISQVRQIAGRQASQ